MWVKNLNIYRVPAPWAIDRLELEAALTKRPFAPCTELEHASQGWTPPCGGDQLVYEKNRQLMVKIKTEKKLLPTSVVNRVAQEASDKLAQEQGFKPGKKQMKEIKDRVTDELLSRAFCIHSFTSIWIDTVNGWLVIDAASASAADDAIKLLMQSVEGMPLQSLRTTNAPLTAMTGWLAADEAPENFSIDQDSELKASGAGAATVRYLNQSLNADDMRRHIEAGKQCTKLAMTWSDRISFVLTESLTIKRISALDIIKTDELATNDVDESFDADFVLMTGELNRMLTDIVTALGGERTEQTDLVQELAKPPAKADYFTRLKDSFTDEVDRAMYSQGVAIVREQRRASISLVQRHLRIGYNHAARLIEKMEAEGVVSAMESNGNRTVLEVKA